MRAPHFWINVLHKMYVKAIEDEDKVKHLSRAGIQVSVPSPISSLTVKLWLWLFTIPASPRVMSTSPSWNWISWKQRYSGRHRKKDWSVWLLSYITQMWTVLHISAILAPCSHVSTQSGNCHWAMASVEPWVTETAVDLCQNCVMISLTSERFHTSSYIAYQVLCARK